MIVDTSAAIAILRDEPEAEACARVIESSAVRCISAANFLEAAVCTENLIRIDCVTESATVRSGRPGERERSFRYAPLASGLDIVRKTLDHCCLVKRNNDDRKSNEPLIRMRRPR